MHDLEITIRVPVGSLTMSIPTRERLFEGMSSRVVDSTHVAAVDDLRSVELVDGRLCLKLRSGEKYAFPIEELLTGGKDAKLELRETLSERSAAFGGFEERIRLHELQLARLTSLRLVEPESAGSTPERWSEGQPATVTGPARGD